ncbi:MAG: phosphate starvation-inducible protein PhoH [Bacteroidetes bacterium]|nr:MAG: phosphate starvation-inducible protein PhoH [Bacteroidota bacterium]
MIEKTVLLEDTNPQDLYGSNNRYLNLLKSFFPKLKITARGDKIKINGDDQIVEQFEEKLNLIIRHLQLYNSISENQIERIVMEDGREVAKTYAEIDDVLVHGSGGNLIKARTLNQKRMVKAVNENDMLFAIGPAGTGKTYTGVALAVRALKNKEVKRIILTRPAVEAGENLGFLPGDMKEKLDPYMQPLYDALRDMIHHEKLQYYLETKVIEIAPLAFMRGRTLDHAFVILDEAQNTTHSQMKMFLTRMGKHAKFIVTGDATQVDLPRNQGSGLKEALRILRNVKGISIVELDDKDVIRHPLVKEIIHAYDKEEKKS